MSIPEYNGIRKTNDEWHSHTCQVPLLAPRYLQITTPTSMMIFLLWTSDSFFNVTDERINTLHSSDSDSIHSCSDHLQQCSDIRKLHPNNCLFCYININSVRYKLNELKPVIYKLNPVVFMIAETKIDDSFHLGQFFIDGYHPPFRRDKTAYGGGLLAYVRSDIPCRLLDQPTHNLESLKKILWNIIVLCRSPDKVNNADFLSDMEFLCEKTTSMYDRTLILGDLNYNLFDPAKSKPICDVMDNYALDNLIQEPTYLKQWILTYRRGPNKQ